ncbi:acetyltransferase [Pedobacter sp. PACM 27299]|uniref:acetyltransferase n=1 Tax=Pedobacter sp. PACM 27299 TaxID=1727164 RepID=UPI0007062345|nr:acetyltransferase [Pedobacter sp. PACM 27299]ALL04386.1 acetyltransferase [Pedobacter sp. PACM 27299]
MKRKKLILIGGGGHCKSCIDVIEQNNQFDIMGILDHENLFGTDVLGYKVIGSDIDIPKYVNLSYSFMIAVGQIRSSTVRQRVFNELSKYNADIATIVSPRAYVSKHAVIGRGTIIMHNVIVNSSAIVGANCILNTGSNIEHDTVIGNHSHISTFAVINGDCKIGEGVFIGSNATISNNIHLGNNIVIGTGSVVVKNIKAQGVYVGNPALKLKI